MLSFSHCNVMSLIGVCFDDEVPLIIMPYMSKGNVLGYVKQNKEDLYFDNQASKEKVCSFMLSLLLVCYKKNRRRNIWA